MTEEKKEARQYYVPVHFLDSETSEVRAISIVKLYYPCTPYFETRKECMEWFKEKGLAGKKFL